MIIFLQCQVGTERDLFCASEYQPLPQRGLVAEQRLVDRLDPLLLAECRGFKVGQALGQRDALVERELGALKSDTFLSVPSHHK